MRPLRNDSKTGESGGVPTPKDHSYHRDFTKEFIRLVVRLYPGTTFHYNDELIYDDKEFRGTVTKAKGHDNHIHIKFPGGN
jgi:hypothetical protein